MSQLSTTFQGAPPAPSPNSPSQAIKYDNPDLNKPYTGTVLGQNTTVVGGQLDSKPASLETTMSNPLQIGPFSK